MRRGLLVPAEDRLPAGVELEQPVYAQHALLRRYALALLQKEEEGGAAAEGHKEYYGWLAGESWQQAELFWPQVEQGWRWSWAAGPEPALAYYYALSEPADLAWPASDARSIG